MVYTVVCEDEEEYRTSSGLRVPDILPGTLLCIPVPSFWKALCRKFWHFDFRTLLQEELHIESFTDVTAAKRTCWQPIYIANSVRKSVVYLLGLALADIIKAAIECS
jgi:hypothetical protein